MHRLAIRDLDGLPPGYGSNLRDLGRWYDESNAYFRFVFRHRPNYVAVDVDDPESLRALARRCGAPNYVWSAANVGRYNHSSTA